MKQIRKLPRFSNISSKTSIDDLINNPSTEVKDLLFFEIAVDPSKVDIRILRFFITNFDKFITYLLLTSNTVEIPYQLACSRIVDYNLDFFIDNTKILNTFYEYAFNLDKYSEASYDAYFSILNSIIFTSRLRTNDTLRNEFKHTDFFESLFKRLDISQCFFFLMRAIVLNFGGIREILSKSENLFEIIVNSILSNSPTESERGQIIFVNLIKINTIKEVDSLMLKDGILDKILQSRIQNPTKSGFLFLKEVLLVCQNNSPKFLSFPPSNNNWKSIKSIITSYTGQYCAYIIECDKFTEVTLGCCKLLNSIFSEQKAVTPLFLNVIEKLNTLFFQYPTNSFLHETFYQTVLLLKTKKLLNQELVDRLNLPSQIIECYKNRDKIVTAAYWGHLRLISELISSMGAKRNPEWKKVVALENKRREKIIHNEYGGFHKPSSTPYFAIIFLVFAVVFLLVLYFGIKAEFSKKKSE